MSKDEKIEQTTKEVVDWFLNNTDYGDVYEVVLNLDLDLDDEYIRMIVKKVRKSKIKNLNDKL